MPFQAQIDLLRSFLARRDDVVERIQGLLNAQRRPDDYLRDGDLLSHYFDECFATSAALKGPRYDLEAAHWASGFKPRPIPGLHNGAAEPAEMMTRAFYMWQQTRWPGRNGRVRYAHTLFNLYVVRCLELLSMRLWDAEANSVDSPSDRLAQIQDVLDALWKIKTADQPALVRDARWLIQTAQSLATDDLGAYFRVVEQIAGTLSETDRLELCRAGVRMTGGHLRSQIRYHSTKRAVPFDDDGVVQSTRDSNALDFALLIYELVPLLDAYERACAGDDSTRRLELADAICQGVSPDPELFLNRVDLLGTYSTVEPFFNSAHPVFREYETRIDRVKTLLRDDAPRFRPVAGSYSPYGAIYGFSADLTKHMVLKAAQPEAETRFGLEDVFVAGDATKLAWVNGWRKLPHLKREVEKLFDYPQQFAEDVFDRIAKAFRGPGRVRPGNSPGADA